LGVDNAHPAASWWSWQRHHRQGLLAQQWLRQSYNSKQGHAWVLIKLTLQLPGGAGSVITGKDCWHSSG
jgi:hypothetical protein